MQHRREGFAPTVAGVHAAEIAGPLQIAVEVEAEDAGRAEREVEPFAVGGRRPRGVAGVGVVLSFGTRSVAMRSQWTRPIAQSRQSTTNL